jgi:hypothetical protein
VPLTDLTGSTLALVDSADSVTAQYAYDPFGNVTASGQSIAYPYQYAGMALDQTGLYFNGRGYYNPALGRPLEGYGAPNAPGGGQGGGAGLPSGGAGGGGVGFGSFASPGVAVNGAIGAGAGAAIVAGYAGFAVATASAEAGITFGAAFSAALSGPPGWIALAVFAVVAAALDLFGVDLFGGGSRPTPPPMLYRFFHYVAAEFLGLLACLAPNMLDSAAVEAATPFSSPLRSPPPSPTRPRRAATPTAAT